MLQATVLGDPTGATTREQSTSALTSLPIPHPGETMSVSQETASALVQELFELQRVMRRVLKASITERELSVVQMSLLSHLASVPARRAKDIGAESGLGASVMSRQLSHLEKLGFIERTPDPEDGRAQLVQITERGRTAVADNLESDTRGLIERLGALSEDDAARTRQDLNRLTETFLTSLGLERMTTHIPRVDPQRPRNATTQTTTTETARRLEDSVQ
ncbi:MarR family winged helix-turn-helix transcriptional regulator [Kocuria sp.]|uniref:MarR family winged helix-turn-helix transcriptional regulator n=1 Tax=Kocuria sp. TaxID=1871328 RepID=UPI0026DF49CA|nr:MarR family winged helix-turn-helix transcriptional regulator [Kocuria sp.]MDO5366735.1 MarR family winged helix-turn-helix transcriptional regulator [Kocuria sp.]